MDCGFIPSSAPCGRRGTTSAVRVCAHARGCAGKAAAAIQSSRLSTSKLRPSSSSYSWSACARGTVFDHMLVRGEWTVYAYAVWMPVGMTEAVRRDRFEYSCSSKSGLEEVV